MGRFARIVGAASILAAPVLLGVADHLRMLSEDSTEEVGVASETGDAQALAQATAIARNLGMYQAAAWLALAGALVSIPAVAAMWAVSKDRSPRWAWAGLVLGVLGVFGQAVHLVAYYAHQLLFATAIEPATGAQVSTELESQAYFSVLFLPFFLGFLAFIPQVVALRRARVIPVWTTIVGISATVVFTVMGSSPISTTVWMLGLAIGLAPAAHRMATVSHEVEQSLSPVSAEHIAPAVA